MRTSAPTAKARAAFSLRWRREPWPVSGTAGSPHGWQRQLAGRRVGELRIQVRSELHGPAMAGGVFSGDPLDFWERHSAMRDRVRPIIADEAKSHQFLRPRSLLSIQFPGPCSWIMSLEISLPGCEAARQARPRRLWTRQWVEQFPRSEGAGDPTLGTWALFGRWIEKAKPAPSTVDRWRSVFLRLQEDFPHTNAAALLPEQMQQWANGLINADRSARTVSGIWVSSARTVFSWAVAEKLISRNPFVGWRIKVPRKSKTRKRKHSPTTRSPRY